MIKLLIKKIIPRKVKEIIKMYLYKVNYKKYKKFCETNNQKEYILFGTPVHGNLGDHAIALAEYKLLEDCNIKPFEIPTYEEFLIYDHILKNITKDAVILITGGGSIGSQWMVEEEFIRRIINDYKEHKIIVFPQTIFYKEDENGKEQIKKDIDVYSKAKYLTICTRENKSYELAKQMHKNVNVLLLPEIVLYLEPEENKCEEKNEEILLCIRKDVESKMSIKERESIEEIVKKYSKQYYYTDTVIPQGINKNNRKEKIIKKLREFSKAKLIITDRLHGMIFAYLVKTPCIAIGNYNYKVEGVYNWIKDKADIIFLNDITQIEQEIQKMQDKTKETCDQSNLKEQYDILKKVIK